MHLTQQVKILCSSYAAVLSDIECFILLSFKNGIPNNTVYQLKTVNHTPATCMYYKWYIRTSCTDDHVLLSKSQWAYLMDLASRRTSKY